ncbi:MAG TPA: sialidase family protein [Mucilaginibacter sp.]|nr:sialidase family protein [Mucilaginibacter sp.]
MKKYQSLYHLLPVFLLLAGCSKDKSTQPNNNNLNSVKIEIISGNNQSDTIGKQLASPLVVKITKNGSPVSGVYVRFRGSGCNADNDFEIASQADGTAKYLGFLSGDVGQQTFKAYATDSNDKNIDSVSFNCTGLEPGAGWHLSGCNIPFGAIPEDFCTLSTGRLFTSYGASIAYMRYSDDNARNWYPVVSAGKHSFQYILSNSADELFAFSSDAGTLYSSDQGKTWASLGTTPFGAYTLTGASYGKDGKILVSTQNHGLYISSDKGKTWSQPTGVIKLANSTGPDGDFHTFIEDQSGNFYVAAGNSGTLYKSVDEGASWTAITPYQQEQVYSFYVDQHNWFYESRWDSNGGVYISKDNGATYSILYNAPGHFVSNMSVQPDGNFYVSDSTEGLYSGKGIGTPFRLVFYNAYPGLFVPYIVAKNNNLVVSDTGGGQIRYYQH